MEHGLVRSLRIVLVASLFLISVVGCDREPPKPKVIQDRSRIPETAAGEIAIRAIEKAKGLENTLGQAADRTTDTLKGATP